MSSTKFACPRIANGRRLAGWLWWRDGGGPADKWGKRVEFFKRTPAVLRATAWMSGTLISFVVMAVAVRELSASMQSFEILFFRSAVGLILVLAVALAGPAGLARLRTRQPVLQVLRNVFHFGGSAGWVYGISALPLAVVTAIEFTTPVWVAMLAVVFLRERLNRGRAVAIVLGFAGVLVILRPGLEVVHPAALIVLAGAFGYGTSHTATKKLIRTDSPLAVLFYMTVVQIPLGLVPALFQWTAPRAVDTPWILVVGLAGLTAHYCIARAFLLADAIIVVPMDFLRLPLVALVGLAVYGETFAFAIVAGALMIFSGTYYSIYRENKARRAGLATPSSKRHNPIAGRPTGRRP